VPRARSFPAVARLLLAPLLVAALVLVLPPPLARAATTPPVTGNDESDIYVGTGGLLIPSKDWRGDPGGRQEAASCEGCDWRITAFCTLAVFDSGGCPASRIGCPVGEIRVRVWQRMPGEPWRFVGAACQGAPPRTRSEVGAAVRARSVAALPVLRAAVQPRGPALTGLPAVFRTGQPALGIRGADLSLLGFDIVLDSRVRWHWDYGDGTDVWSSQPGGLWPDLSVAHSYRSAGDVSVTVTAVWRGQYVVDGLGPFPVPGAPLTQQATLPMAVRSAHAVLVG
jgi:hypothetical protein